MVKKLFVTLILLFSLIPLQLMGTCGAHGSSYLPIKVGAYYYPWYVGKAYGTIQDSPVFGWSDYYSNSTNVINKQLDWMEYLDIDFIITSWWGDMQSTDHHDPINFTNTCTQILIDTIKSSGSSLSVALIVEPFNETGGYDYAWIYNYIYDNYVTDNPNYLRLNERPLLLFFNAENLTGNGMQFDDRFEIRIAGSKDYVNWGYDIPSEQKIYADGYTFVTPRYVAYGHSFDPTFSEGLYDNQWSQALNWARQGKIKYIAIITWNEYGERTQIEPSNVTGSCNPTNYFLMFEKTYNYIKLAKSIASPSNYDTSIAVSLIVSGIFIIIALAAIKRKRKNLKNSHISKAVSLFSILTSIVSIFTGLYIWIALARMAVPKMVKNG